MSTRKRPPSPTAEEKARQDRIRSGDTRVQRDDGPRRDGPAPGAWRDRPAQGTGQDRRFDGPPRPYSDRPRNDGPGRPYSDRPRNDGPRNFDGPRPYSDRPRNDGPGRPYGDRPRNDGPPRNFDGPRPYSDRPRNDGPRNFDGPRPYSDRPRNDGPGRPYGDRPRNDGPPRNFDGPRPYSDRPRNDGPGRPYGDRPRNDGPPRNFDGPRPYNDRPRNDGPSRDSAWGGPRNDGQRFDRGRGPDADGNIYQQRGDGARPYNDRQRQDGPPRNFDGPRRFDGPRQDGPPRNFDGPRRFDGPRQDGPPRNFDGPRRFDGPRQDGPQRNFERGDRNDRRRSDRHHQARPRTTARDVAAFAVMRVVDEGAFSNLALRTALRESSMERRDRAFATRLTYGTLTWLGYIDAVLNAMLPKGIDSLPPEVASHMRIAMYQLLMDREHTPVHAAIDECVELVGNIEPKLRGLTNGVLRNFERGRDDVLEKVRSTHPIEVELSLSPEVAAELKRRVSPEAAVAIMQRWNGATPVVVRARDANRDALAEVLRAEEGVICDPHPLAPDALIFQGDIRSVIELNERASVQDAGAQLVAYTLPPDLDGTIIDACAGLGGKTLHLLDQLHDVQVIACDVDKRKLSRIPTPEDEDRLVLIAGDMAAYSGAEAIALHAAAHGDHEGFSAIVIDAPCSALGTLGRHPEVRWRRTQDDVASLSRVQRNLLKTMAPLVRPGGYLVYVVCTFTEAETLTQVDRFLQAHPDFVLAPPTADDADPRVDWASLVDQNQTISLWPEPHNTDGFFIARFQKSADALMGGAEDFDDEDDARFRRYDDEDDDAFSSIGRIADTDEAAPLDGSESADGHVEDENDDANATDSEKDDE